jgi:hypothetical protein
LFEPVELAGKAERRIVPADIAGPIASAASGETAADRPLGMVDQVLFSEDWFQVNRLSQALSPFPQNSRSKCRRPSVRASAGVRHLQPSAF